MEKALCGPFIPILPCADADLVALWVGEDPERARAGIANKHSACIESGRDPGFRLVVRHCDVEVDPIALRPGLVHLLEPHSRELPGGVDDRVLRSLVARLVGEPQDCLPEWADGRDVKSVNRDLEHL